MAPKSHDQSPLLMTKTKTKHAACERIRQHQHPSAQLTLSLSSQALHNLPATAIFPPRMARSTGKDARDLFRALWSAYSATPTSLKIIDLYVMFAVSMALIQVVYMAIVGSFPFNSFLSGVLSCVGTAVLSVCFRIQLNKENKEFKDLAPERAFADFVFCNMVLHLVIMNFIG